MVGLRADTQSFIPKGQGSLYFAPLHCSNVHCNFSGTVHCASA